MFVVLCCVVFILSYSALKMNIIYMLYNLYRSQYYIYVVPVYAVGVPVLYGACCVVCVLWLTVGVRYVGRVE
jgi:hypothetical protein